MDQFSAHLDRGWDLVQRGDSAGAELSARRALEIDSQSPEAYNLLGYVAAMQGDFEEAVEHYRTAISLDDTYFEAMLNAAEIYIHPLGDVAEAVNLCDQALDLAESDEERVDALLLKFDAMLADGNVDEAKRLCSTFPRGPYDNPMHSFLVARAFYESGDVQHAEPLIEAAVKEMSDNPEAWYYLGLIRDDRGDTITATRAFLAARELDLLLPPPPWTLTRDTFELTVSQAVQTLPEELAQFLRPEEAFVADLPGVEVVADGVDPRALLLLDGVMSRPGEKPSARLIVYQRNVERQAGSISAIPGEILTALAREITAAFLERPSDVAN